MYSLSIRTADYGAVANREGSICAQLKYGREPNQIQFVPNGVEEQFFTERAYGTKSPLRLLYVGTWLDRKGVYYLADAFQLLIKANVPVCLTIAGCGNSEENVKSFFSPEVRDRVHVVPFVERKHMPAIYAGHDIFVFPSLVEGMPLTLLEAMAGGMPVVTTNTSGMADVVENGFNGLLVPPADATALAAVVARLTASAELRQEVGQEAQNTMRRYSWERVARQLEGILMLTTRDGERN